MRPSMTASTHAAFERGYEVLSFPFRIRSSVPEVGPALEQLLAPFRATWAAGVATYSFVRSERNGQGFALYRGRRCVRRSHSPVLLLEHLLSEVNSRAIASVTRYLTIHAAAASLGGHAVLMPAPPNGGKTTTVAGLVRAGFDYITDEAALIDPSTLDLHPYPRPLALERASAEAVFGTVPERLSRWRGAALHVSPHDLREGSIGRSCPVGWVVIPRYAGGGSTQLVEIGKPDALEALVRNSFNLATWGATGFEVLAELVRRARCYELTIGDLPTAVAAIRSVCEEVPAELSRR